MLTRNERPRSRIILATTEIPAAYHADLLRWWTINSPSWSEHIDADGNRKTFLEKLAQRAAGLVGRVERPAVTDVGCGEGAFLRALRQILPAATLQGVDFCPEMLAEARRRSASHFGLAYALGDLEQPGFAPEGKAHLVTSVLAMDEMDQLADAFVNIARILKPGGVAMLVVMDPAKEFERNQSDIGAALGCTAHPEEPVLLVKTFPRADMEPAAPYSRIMRPLGHYIAAADAAGLRPEPVERWPHAVGIGPYSDTLVFDIFIFRKSAG